MTGIEAPGTSMAIPLVLELCAKAVSADGVDWVNARMAVTIAEVHFSIPYNAEESVALAWTVAL